MDVVQRVGAQLQDRFRSMTAGARLTVALSAALAIFCLGYWALRPAPLRPEVDLLHGVRVTPNQLFQMEAAFGKANLKDYTTREGTIFVRQGQESTYLNVLKMADALPSNLSEEIVEAASNGNLIESNEQRNTRMRAIKQKAVGRAIASKPGIEWATVVYDDEKSHGFNQKVTTAIVYIKPTADNQLDEAAVLDIRCDVAGAYAGLKPEDVTVSDQNGRTWRGEIGNAAALVAENRRRAARQTCERELREKILAALKHISDITVVVNVELDGTAAKPSAAATEIASARVSISVPASHFVRIWQSRHPELPATATRTETAAIEQVRVEETANLQRFVASLLPPCKNAWTSADQVVITVFQDAQPTATASTDYLPLAINWLASSWKVLGGAALLLFVFLVLRSSVRKTSPNERLAEIEDDSLGTSSGEQKSPFSLESRRNTAAADLPPAGAELTPTIASPHHRRADAEERSVRRELSALVEDHPEMAASILRHWIGQGG